MSVTPARFVIIDAHAHAFRAFYALAPMTGPEGLPINALYGLAGQLKRLLFEERPEYLAIVFDPLSTQRQNFRCELYPAYKANRPERPADLQVQLPLLREVARAFGLQPLEHDRYEADDYIATLVEQAEQMGLETTILSADKDLMQLVSPRTRLWDTMRGVVYTPEKVEEKLGVKPHQVADYLALVGDTSDNVPGVSGIGPRSASKLLARHDTLEGIYAHLALCSPKERAKLEAGRELAFLSRELTRLSLSAPMDCSLEELVCPPIREFALDAMCERFGLRALRNELRATMRLSAVTASQHLPSHAPQTTAPMFEDLPLDNLELWGDETELSADGFPELSRADELAHFSWSEDDLPFGPAPDLEPAPSTLMAPHLPSAVEPPPLSQVPEQIHTPSQLTQVLWFLDSPLTCSVQLEGHILCLTREHRSCRIPLLSQVSRQASLFEPTPEGISHEELAGFLRQNAAWLLTSTCDGLPPDRTLANHLGLLL